MQHERGIGSNGREQMKHKLNIFKGVLFLSLGIALLLIPYSQFKKVFPAAPAPLILRGSGIVIALCGIVILAAVFMDGR